MDEKILVEVTSSAFVGPGGCQKLSECIQACKKHGFSFGIQLHNTSPESEIAQIVAFRVPMSAHAPLLSEYSINLAAEDASSSMEEIRRNARIMRCHQIKRAVFHGFAMTDKQIPAFGRGVSYDAAMRTIFRPELSLDGVSRLGVNFLGTPEYHMRCGRVKERLAQISREYPDLIFCIENDFPAYGSANLFAGDSAAELNHPLCLDSSHLWAAAFICGRDFHAETAAFLNTGKVMMVHLHASAYTAATNCTEWGDGHLPLATPNQMDLPRFVRACRDSGVKHFVLEVIKATSADIDLFAEMWKS